MCNCKNCQGANQLSCNCGGLNDLTDEQIIKISEDEALNQVNNINFADLALSATTANLNPAKNAIASTGRAVAKRICTEGAIAKIKENAGYVAGAGVLLVGIGYIAGKFSKKGKRGK